jgi:hypothetical protein
VGQERIVDQRRLVTVTSGGVPWAGGGIANDRNFEAVFEEVAQVGLDAHIREHAAEDDLGDAPFAQL